MSDCSLSPKRKASRTIGSPSKRVTLGVDSAIGNWAPGIPNGEMSVNIDTIYERTIPDVAIRIHPVCRPVNQDPVEAESGSSDSNDTATTIDNDGLFVLHDDKGEML